jgi:hypothetical protein
MDKVFSFFGQAREAPANPFIGGFRIAQAADTVKIREES